MQNHFWSLLLTCALLSACGGGGGDGVSAPGDPGAPVPSVPQTGFTLLDELPLPGISPGTDFRFGQGLVVRNRYYLADQTNSTIDMFDAGSGGQLGQITGLRVPTSLTEVGALLYVGDIDSVKVVDTSTAQVVNSIPLGTTSGLAAGGGCFDATHNLYMVATPGANPPVASFIDTRTQVVVAQVVFGSDTDVPERVPLVGQPTTTRIGQCRYDAVTDNFYVGRSTYGAGSILHASSADIALMPGGSVRNIVRGGTSTFVALDGKKRFASCGEPDGLALGPGTQMAVSCGGSGAFGVGHGIVSPNDQGMYLLDRVTGDVIRSMTATYGAPAYTGGRGQLEYDATTGRYYVAVAPNPDDCEVNTRATCSQVLFAVDPAGVSDPIQVATGYRASSLAIEPVTRKVFVPVSAGSASVKCPSCGASPARILIFAMPSGV